MIIKKESTLLCDNTSNVIVEDTRNALRKAGFSDSETDLFAEKLIGVLDDYAAFCERVKKEVPEHKHLPKADELQRMAVQSFRKHVRAWNPNDAPVQGKRFTAYQKIGLKTLGLLETTDNE